VQGAGNSDKTRPVPTPDELDPASERVGRGHKKKRGGAATSPLTTEERVLSWLLVTTVVGSVLAVGTVHIPTLVAVSAFAVASAALAVRARVLSSGRPPLSAPVVLLLALTAYTLFQAAPLPMALLAKIAPANADVWARALLPFGEPGPRWASLSLDPGASLVEALKWFDYACVFVAAAVLSSRRTASWGIFVVFVAAIAAALVTIGHGLSGATKVFGLYEPRFAVAPWHVGPLLNPNNLAGYLNLGAMCGLGLLLMRTPLARRWVIGLGVATIVGVAVTCASRGGFLALPIGILLLAGALRFRHSGTVSKDAVRWLMAVAVGGGALLAVLGGTRDTWAELYDKNLSKIAMIVWAKPMIGEHPIFGIGRGAFESVFPQYRTEAGNIVFTHAENFPAQWIAEWGLPVGLAALVLFAWMFRPRNVGVTRSAVVAGASLGVFIVLVHNMVDLALEVPAVCIAIAMVMGSVWGDGARRGRQTRWSEGKFASPERVGTALAATVGCAGVVLVALVARWGWHPVAADREELHELYTEDGAKREPARVELRRRLKAAMLAHPAEPYFPLLGGLVAWVGRDDNALPWLERTLERAQLNGRAHLLLAQVLAARPAESQALFELSLAVHDDVGLAYSAAQMATRITQSYEELLRAVPRGAAGAPMLEACAGILGAAADRGTRVQLLRESLSRDAGRAGPHVALAYDMLAQIAQGDKSDVCSGDRRRACLSEVQEHARAVEAVDMDSSEADRLRASALEVDGRADEAERLLGERCPKASDRVQCLYAQAAAAAKIKTPERVGAVVKEMVVAGCASSAQCAQTNTYAGDLLAGRGEWGGATTHYERAVREEPTEARWLRLADAAGRSGAHARAADALEKVAKLRGGGDDALRRRINDERATAVGVGR
jgi:tetratricopeptide (TPR) repeat protein